MEQETDYTIWDAVKRLDARLDTFSSETAEWIDELQAEDARLGARIKELEALVKDLYGIYEAREERLDVMGRRIKELEKRMAELEAAPELLRVPSGHGLLPDDAYTAAVDDT